MRYKIAIALVCVLLITLNLSGCTSKQESLSDKIIGSWRSGSGEIASITKSYAYIPSYGTGNWDTDTGFLVLKDSMTGGEIARFSITLSEDGYTLTLTDMQDVLNQIVYTRI